MRFETISLTAKATHHPETALCFRRVSEVPASERLVPDVRETCFGHLAPRRIRRGMTRDGGEKDIASQQGL
jgi:hypothetical protein